MEKSPAAPTDGFDKALSAERLRNGRLLNLLRLLGVSLFLALVLREEFLKQAAVDKRYPELLTGYWLFSLALFVVGYVSDRMTRLGSLAIALVDVPLVFLIQLEYLHRSADPRAVANFALGLFLLLVMLAAMALRGWPILLTAVLAIASERFLQQWAGEPPLGVLGGMLLIGLAAALCDIARRRRVEMVGRVCAEQLLRERLGRYFSPQVAEHIQAEADDLAAGKDCEVTVMFADLCGFTALSEKLGSARTVALLNEFQGRMVEAVFDGSGTMDKYIGDGLMAYFGAPLPQPAHAERAIVCALAMHEALAEFIAQRLERRETPLAMRIGIHSGPAVVGSIGAPHRREFTVVGDTVNVASRLEQVAKLLGEDIVISEEARRRISEKFVCKPLEAVAVKGKASPVTIYAPVRQPTGASRSPSNPQPSKLASDVGVSS